MKQFKNFAALLSTLFLLSMLTSCELDPVTVPDDTEPQPQYRDFEDLFHYAKGNSTIETKGQAPTQQLIINNVNNIREDGVRIDLEDNSKFDMYFEPVAIPPLGAMEIMAIDQATDEPFSGIRLSSDPEGNKQIEAFIAGQDTLVVQGFREGELVVQDTIVSDERWIWIPIVAAWYIADHVSAHYEWNSDGSSSGGVDWNGTAPNGNGPGNYPKAEIRLPENDETFKVDLIKFSSLGATLNRVDKAAIEIQGKDLGTVIINDEVKR